MQPLRERAATRVAQCADSLGVCVNGLSSRERRLLAAVSDLPELFPTTHQVGDLMPYLRMSSLGIVL